MAGPDNSRGVGKTLPVSSNYDPTCGQTIIKVQPPSKKKDPFTSRPTPLFLGAKQKSLIDRILDQSGISYLIRSTSASNSPFQFKSPLYRNPFKTYTPDPIPPTNLDVMANRYRVIHYLSKNLQNTEERIYELRTEIKNLQKKIDEIKNKISTEPDSIGLREEFARKTSLIRQSVSQLIEV
jgi:hypothetical protein